MKRQSEAGTAFTIMPAYETPPTLSSIMPSTRLLAVPLGAIAAAITIHALWGANFVAVKYGLQAFPPMWSAFLRFALGVACVLAWALLAKVRVWPERGEWTVLLGIGVLFTVQIGSMNIGIDLSTSSMAAVLMASNPLFAAGFAHLLIPGDRLTPPRVMGLAIAFAGVLAVLLSRAPPGLHETVSTGNIILLASACLLGLRLALAGRSLQRINEAKVALWQMLTSLPLFLTLALSRESIAWERIDWQPIAGIVYQGVVIAGMGFTINFYLMRRYRPSVMMSFNFVSPVTGVLLGAWLLRDPVSAPMIAGVALVALGLVLVARR